MNPTYKYALLRVTMREREGHYESYESYERGVTMGENSSTMRYDEEEHTGQRRSRDGAEMGGYGGCPLLHGQNLRINKRNRNRNRTATNEREEGSEPATETREETRQSPEQ